MSHDHLIFIIRIPILGRQSMYWNRILFPFCRNVWTQREGKTRLTLGPIEILRNVWVQKARKILLTRAALEIITLIKAILREVVQEIARAGEVILREVQENSIQRKVILREVAPKIGKVKEITHTEVVHKIVTVRKIICTEVIPEIGMMRRVTLAEVILVIKLALIEVVLEIVMVRKVILTEVIPEIIRMREVIHAEVALKIATVKDIVHAEVILEIDKARKWTLIPVIHMIPHRVENSQDHTINTIPTAIQTTTPDQEIYLRRNQGLSSLQDLLTDMKIPKENQNPVIEDRSDRLTEDVCHLPNHSTPKILMSAPVVQSLSQPVHRCLSQYHQDHHMAWTPFSEAGPNHQEALLQGPQEGFCQGKDLHLESPSAGPQWEALRWVVCLSMWIVPQWAPLRTFPCLHWVCRSRHFRLASPGSTNRCLI